MYTTAITALESELARMLDDRDQTNKLIKALRKVESYGYDRSSLINTYSEDVTLLTAQIKEIRAAMALLRKA